jgi:hypothetical protein
MTGLKSDYKENSLREDQTIQLLSMKVKATSKPRQYSYFSFYIHGGRDLKEG